MLHTISVKISWYPLTNLLLNEACTVLNLKTRTEDERMKRSLVFCYFIMNTILFMQL